MPMGWRAWLMSVRGSSMSMPSTTTDPADGSSRRLRQRSRVDLPEPDGPITKTSSRSATLRSTPFSTCRWPKCLWMPRASTMGVISCGPRASRAPHPAHSDAPEARETRAVRKTSTAVQLVRGGIVAGHAGRAVAWRDHHREVVGLGLLVEPLLVELGHRAVLLHAVERILQLRAQLGIVLGHRRRPVGARVLELEVGDEIRVLRGGV